MKSYVIALVALCLAVTPTLANQALAQKQWTVMIYMGADNNLEPAAIDDINEMETVGSTNQVNVVVQVDRHPGFNTSNGNWSTTRRYYITQDANTSVISSTLISDLGEQNMGAPSTLSSFIGWAMTNYPAQKYFLIIWDHGSGWQKSAPSVDSLASIAFEAVRNPVSVELARGQSASLPEDLYRARLSGESNTKYLCVDETNNDRLYNNEIQQVLSANPTLSIIGFDACLMAMVEVAYEFRQYAEFMIASEELEPADGWAYHIFLDSLVNRPNISASTLCSLVVDSYALDMGGSSDHWQTLSAVDLSAVDALKGSIDAFVASLISEGVWSEVRAYIPYSEQFGKSTPQQYRDLHHIAAIVASNLTGAAVQLSALSVMAAIENCVIRNFTEANHNSSGGLSIYLPMSSTNYDLAYELGALDFAEQSLWTEFLRFFWWGPSATVYDIPEPNDYPSQCGFPLDTTYLYQSYLPNVSDRDWWLIHTGIAETLTVALSVPLNADFDLLIYDVAGSTLLASSEAAGNGVGEEIKYFTGGPGNFAVKVVPFLSSSASPYTLHVGQQGHKTGSFELSYDDGLPDGAYYSENEGDVIGVMWELPSYPMKIDRLWIYFSSIDAAGTGGNGSFWLLFFDNYGYLLDPIELGPLQPGATGWNYLDLTGLNITANTAVFAGIYYDGVNTPAVGYDLTGRGKDYYMPGSGTGVVPLNEGLFFRMDLSYPQTILSTEDESGSLPEEFSVSQNYPNPFNASTRVEFYTRLQSEVSVEVINLLGRSVWTKNLGVLTAGQHTIEWNGTDSQGITVGSGVYFYRVTCGDSEISRKMVFLK